MSEPLACSARGCQQPAVWALVWNNPQLHTPDRRKTWLACEEHREQLESTSSGPAASCGTSSRSSEAPVDPGPDR